MKWIYRYIRAGGEEIDMGLYDFQGEAEMYAEEHANFGAIVSKPIEVPNDYKLYKGNVDVQL